jgi:hypothetical protein
MAKDKTEIDVELTRIKAERDLARDQLRHHTIRWGMGFATVSLGIIVWAIVRVTDRPAWLTFALALLTAATPPATVAWRLAVRLRRLKTRLREQGIAVDDEQPVATEDGS